MFKKLYRYLSEPIQLSIINTILVISGFVANRYFQVFCVPTLWASIVLIICSLYIIIIPLSNKENVILSFISGIIFCVFLYCIFFLAWMNVWGVPLLLFYGLGLLVYVPHFFVGQIIRRNLIKSKTRTTAIGFSTGIIFCICVIIYSNFHFQEALNNISEYKKGHFSEIEQSFFTEKIIGMHFIYHTRFCEYDGWRPPKHEPLLIVNLWLTINRENPLKISLKERLALYRKVFPNNPVKFDCSCARQYSNMYHKDQLWK